MDVHELHDAIWALACMSPSYEEVNEELGQLGDPFFHNEPSIAFQFYNWLRSKEGYRHNKDAFSTMIAVLLPEKGRKRFREMKKIVADMRWEGHAIDPSLCETISRACATIGRFHDVDWIIDCLKADKGQTSKKLYSDLMGICLQSNCNREVLEFGNKMEFDGFQHDDSTYLLMVKAASRLGKNDLVEKFMTELMPRSKLHTPLAAYAAAITVYAKAGNVQKAEEWYQAVVDEGSTHNNETFNAMLRAYLEANQVTEARRFMTTMPYKGGVSSHTVAMLLGWASQSRDGDRMALLSMTGHPSHQLVQHQLPMALQMVPSQMKRLMQSQKSLEEKRKLSDSMIDYLHKRGRKKVAGVIWDESVNLNLYSLLCPRNRTNLLWDIDLHGLSAGTAQIALSRTLVQLQKEAVKAGIKIQKLTIITGRGQHSRIRGVSCVRLAIQGFLDYHSFPYKPEDGSYYCDDAEELHDWLQYKDNHGSLLVEKMHLL